MPISTRATRPRGRPVRSVDDTEARERILDAARRLFAQSGYHDATLQQIARLADVTRPAINHHFSGKQELYEVVLDDVQRRVVTTSLAAADGLPFVDRIAAFLASAVSIDADDPSYAAFITASLLDAARTPELQHLARRQLAELRAFLVKACTDALEDGTLQPGTDPVETAEALLAIVWGAGLYGAYIGTHEQLAAVTARIESLLHLLTRH